MSVQRHRKRKTVVSAIKSKSFLSIVLESLGWPLFWGLAATFMFYLLLGWGVIRSESLTRYLAGHPVEYVETTLFFIAVMALMMKAADLAYQFRSLPAISLPAARESGDPPSRATELLDSLSRTSARLRATYLARRLSNALGYIQRSESVDDVDGQLKYLSDVDAERSHEGYALIGMIIWATPMLGFLGTVIGITMALGDLSPEALINAPKEAMQGLLAGLSVAFDTTALALSLSIVLMFLQYLTRQVESQLLTAVDRRAADEMIGRFQQLGTATDPNVRSIEKMSLRVMESVELLVKRQTELWHEALGASQHQWIDALHTTRNTIESGFRGALDQGMSAHAEALAKAEQLANQRSTERWEQIQNAMHQQSQALAAQHAEMTKQGSVMLKVLAATGEVVQLESALNHNLSALAGSKNFEDTVMSLSAAIHLLSTRLGLTKSQSVQLRDDSPGKGRAA
jgi:biopolymer transport protein ExbB/TolQ